MNLQHWFPTDQPVLHIRVQSSPNSWVGEALTRLSTKEWSNQGQFSIIFYKQPSNMQFVTHDKDMASVIGGGGGVSLCPIEWQQRANNRDKILEQIVTKKCLTSFHINLWHHPAFVFCLSHFSFFWLYITMFAFSCSWLLSTSFRSPFTHWPVLHLGALWERKPFMIAGSKQFATRGSDLVRWKCLRVNHLVCILWPFLDANELCNDFFYCNSTLFFLHIENKFN